MPATLGEDALISSLSSVRGVLNDDARDDDAGRSAVEVHGALGAEIDQQIGHLRQRQARVVRPTTVGSNGEQSFSGTGDRQPGLGSGREILVEFLGRGRGGFAGLRAAAIRSR